MPKPRTCPHCHVVIPFETGFHYDGKLNLICGTCKKIALPSNDSDDSYTLFSSTIPNYNYNPHAQHAHQEQNRHVEEFEHIQQERPDWSGFGSAVSAGEQLGLPSGRTPLADMDV